MVERATAGKLKGWYVVGANPIGRLAIDPFAFSRSFVVAQDMFLTETAVIADVVLPAANAYEKSGTFTNTCGDLQLVKKAGELTGTKSDFEIIVRIADAMGYDVGKLVPFGRGITARHGTVTRRAIRRSGPTCGLAGGARTRTQDESLRSHGHSRRDPAPGAGL